jgi:mRNA interferase MazF
MNDMTFQRGDIILANFDPALAGEAASTRPAIVVSSNDANNLSPAIAVIPMTSNLERVYPNEYVLKREQTGLEHDSKAQIQLIRSIGRQRIRRVLGSVPNELMPEIDARILEFLGLRITLNP